MQGKKKKKNLRPLFFFYYESTHANGITSLSARSD